MYNCISQLTDLFTLKMILLGSFCLFMMFSIPLPLHIKCAFRAVSYYASFSFSVFLFLITMFICFPSFQMKQSVFSSYVMLLGIKIIAAGTAAVLIGCYSSSLFLIIIAVGIHLLNLNMILFLLLYGELNYHVYLV